MPRESQDVSTTVTSGWMREYALLMELFRCWGVATAMEEHVFIKRKDGYGAVDLLAFATALFCAGARGVNGFSRKVREEGLGPTLAELASRKNLGTQASMSQLLSSVDQENCAAFREHVLTLPVARAPAAFCDVTSVVDSRGERWLVVDLDGVVTAYRERALPEGPEVPQPRRRAAAVARPGYPGRKRGETQTSSNRMHHRGSGIWTGQDSCAGNAVMSEGVQLVVTTLHSFLDHIKTPADRVIIRMDGAGGNGPCANIIRAAGMHFLTRTANYELFQQPHLVQHLNAGAWYAVVDGQTGPRRNAAEFCICPLGDVQTRIVASAFPTRDGCKHGAGHVIGNSQFELYGTSLPPESFAAEDIVALYYNRGGAENDYGRLNEEMGVNHTFTTNLPGQDLMVQIAMLVSNAQTIAGTLLHSAQLLPAQREPRIRKALLLDEPALEALAVPAPPPPPPPPSPLPATPAVAPPNRISGASVDLKTLDQDQTAAIHARLPPGWSFAAGELRCPDQHALRIHDVNLNAAGEHHLVMRASRAHCRDCPVRSGCTNTQSTTFQKEMSITVAGTLPLRSSTDVPPLESTPTRHLPAKQLPPLQHIPSREEPPPTVEPPTFIKPGGHHISLPSFVPGAARNALRTNVRQAILTLIPAPAMPQPPTRHPLCATSQAQRQHRRNTFQTRNEKYRANPPTLILNGQPLLVAFFAA